MLFVGVILLGQTGCRGLLQPGREPGIDREMNEQERQLFATMESRLRSAGADERLQAAIALLSMDHPAGLLAVRSVMVNADSPAHRVSMIRAAAFCRDRRCFRAVLSAIDDPYPEVQREAALALAHFTEQDQVKAMIALVRRRDITSRQKQLLYEAFGQGLAIQAVPVLLQGLRGGQEDARAAADALRNISRRDFPAEPEPWQDWWRANAHRTREDVMEEHLQAMSGSVEDLRDKLHALTEQRDELMALVRLPGAGAVKRLLKGLESEHDAVREYVAFRLASLSDEEVKGLDLEPKDYAALRRALEDTAAAVRRNVIAFVVHLEGKLREELVMKALDDEDKHALTAAVNAVGPETGPDALERLGALLAGSPHPEVREAAANALGKVGAAESVGALVAALDDEHDNVRWFAVEGLRKLGAEEAVPSIAEILEKDPSPRVREIAASTLGALGQPAAVPALRKALGDDSERVCQKATGALLILATDDYELMSVIADIFVQHNLLEPAGAVLKRIVEQFADQDGMKDQLIEAYGRLGAILKQQEDLAEAARTYEKLDALKGGDIEVRRLLLDCWLGTQDMPRVVGAFRKWLAAPGAEEPLLELALDTVGKLAAAGKAAEARALVDLVEKNAGDAAGEKIKQRIAELRDQLGT